MTKKENYRVISLLNVNVKLLNKHQQTEFNSTFKKIIHDNKVKYISWMQGFFNIFKFFKSISVIYHINKLKNKNHMIISIDAENAFEKIYHPFMIKNTLQKVGIWGTYYNIIKVIHDKPTATIILNAENLKAFTLRSGVTQGCPLSPSLFNLILEVLDRTTEKVMAPHSSTLAWKIPWTEEPGRLQSMGLRRVGHD